MTQLEPSPQQLELRQEQIQDAVVAFEDPIYRAAFAETMNALNHVALKPDTYTALRNYKKLNTGKHMPAADYFTASYIALPQSTDESCFTSEPVGDHIDDEIVGRYLHTRLLVAAVEDMRATSLTPDLFNRRFQDVLTILQSARGVLTNIVARPVVSPINASLKAASKAQVPLSNEQVIDLCTACVQYGFPPSHIRNVFMKKTVPDVAGYKDETVLAKLEEKGVIPAWSNPHREGYWASKVNGNPDRFIRSFDLPTGITDRREALEWLSELVEEHELTMDQRPIESMGVDKLLGRAIMGVQAYFEMCDGVETQIAPQIIKAVQSAKPILLPVHVITIANEYTKAVNAQGGIKIDDETKQPLQPLQNTIADLPLAFDRLLYVQDQFGEWRGNQEDISLVDMMRALSTEVLNAATAEKLGQRVVTVADIVIKFAGLGPEAVNAAIADMAGSGSTKTHMEY